MNGQAYPGVSQENYTTVLGNNAEGCWNIINYIITLCISKLFLGTYSFPFLIMNSLLGYYYFKREQMNTQRHHIHNWSESFFRQFKHFSDKTNQYIGFRCFDVTKKLNKIFGVNCKHSFEPCQNT